MREIEPLERFRFYARQELFVSSLARTDSPAKLLIEKGLITQAKFVARISEERAVYQRTGKPTVQGDAIR